MFRTTLATFRLAFAMLLVSLALTACMLTETRQVKLTIYGAEGGYVTVNGAVQSVPWTGMFDVGASVTVLAIGDNSYEFNGWSGDLVSTDNPISLTIQGSVKLAPTFSRLPTLSITPYSGDFGAVQLGEERTVTFTVSNQGGGVLMALVETSEPFKVVSGESLHLAQGESQQVVVSFTPTAAGDVERYLTVIGNVLQAFRLNGTGSLAPVDLRELSVLVAGAGAVYSEPPGITCPSVCSSSFAVGAEVSLMVYPGSAIGSPKWTGCFEPAGEEVTSETCTVVMTSVTQVVADFIEDEPVAISVAPETVTVFTGEYLPISATLTGTEDDRVEWSTTGGEIAGAGLNVSYKAPETPGDYSVTVTSVADPSASADVAITVVPSEPEEGAGF